MIELTYGRDYYPNNGAMIDWAADKFGFDIRNYSYDFKGEHRWTVSQAFGHITFKFKNKEDAMLFALKWGQAQYMKEVIE